MPSPRSRLEPAEGWQGCPALAEQEPLLHGQALPVDLVLLQLLVVGVPELHDNPLNVQSIDCVCRDHFLVHLQRHGGKQAAHFHTHLPVLPGNNLPLPQGPAGTKGNLTGRAAPCQHSTAQPPLTPLAKGIEILLLGWQSITDHQNHRNNNSD